MSTNPPSNTSSTSGVRKQMIRKNRIMKGDRNQEKKKHKGDSKRLLKGLEF